MKSLLDSCIIQLRKQLLMIQFKLEGFPKWHSIE